MRSITGDSDLWFVAADVCRSLGLRAHRGSFAEHLQKLDHDDKMQLGVGSPICRPPTPGFNPGVGEHTKEQRERAKKVEVLGPDTWLISEAGLYTLILRSRAPRLLARLHIASSAGSPRRSCPPFAKRAAMRRAEPKQHLMPRGRIAQAAT